MSFGNDSHSKFQIRPPREEKFHGPTVKECIHSVLLDELANKTYNHEMVGTWTTEIANNLRDKVKELGYKRYKLVVQVVIGEQRGAGVKMGSACLWDSDTDNQASDTVSNRKNNFDMLGPQKTFSLSTTNMAAGLDPARNDAPLDFNTNPLNNVVIDLEGPTVSSSGDSWNNERNSNYKTVYEKDSQSFSSNSQIKFSQDRNRDYRKIRDFSTLNRKGPHIVPPFMNPASYGQAAVPNPAAIGASLMQAVGVEPAPWSLGPPTSAPPLGQSSSTLGPSFGAMGVGDPSLLGVMGMTGFGQFGFMRTVDNAIAAAAVLGGAGPSNIVGPPSKDVIQMNNCVLYPPKPNQPPPTTRERPPGCRTVFVGGLPEKCTEDIVREVFSPCGEISTIRMSKKNFCHIRFETESCVDSAIFLSGYRLKIGDTEDGLNTGRMHVDYAQARDDQYEWECRERAIQRELRHRERLEQERLRPPSPPTVVHYSDHEASLLTEKLKCEESFQKAAQVLMTWFDRGELSKKNAGQFYSMLQSTNSHVRRLTNEKTQYEDEMNRAKEVLKQRMQGIFLQFHQIEKVFMAASHQKVWDHFTKAQRKNIDTWRKQAQEIKNAQLEEILNDREESEMDLSDEDTPEGETGLPTPKRQKTSADGSTTADDGANTFETSSSKHSQCSDDEVARLKEENDLLRCQIEAYRNEVEVLRSEASQEKETYEKRLKLLQQALQGMQHQLVAVSQQKSRDDEEIAQLKERLTPGTNANKEALQANLNETSSQSTEVSSNNSCVSSPSEISSTSVTQVKVTEKDVKLIGLVAAFLNVHHFGASIDYIWSYLQHLDRSLQTRDVDNLLSSFPSVFKQEVSGVGAKMERKWKFCGFES